ncbi:MAG TPA: heme exporter protein CcmD [Rhizomicrobium sp.]
MTQFFAMGGYAAFVWPAYGVSFAGLAIAIGLTWRSYAKAKALMGKLEKGGDS